MKSEQARAALDRVFEGESMPPGVSKQQESKVLTSAAPFVGEVPPLYYFLQAATQGDLELACDAAELSEENTLIVVPEFEGGVAAILTGPLCDSQVDLLPVVEWPAEPPVIFAGQERYTGDVASVGLAERLYDGSEEPEGAKEVGEVGEVGEKEEPEG